MRLYLVRHGETVGNLKNLHQTPETPLTPTGVKQAQRVAERLRNREISLIYSSTHLRARNTSEIISRELEVPVELWEGLKEIRRPSEIWGKSSNDPKIAKIENLMIRNFSKKDWKYSDEETLDELAKRGSDVLDHLLAKHAGQVVLCISHGTFIKVLMAIALFGDKLTPKIFLTLRRKMWAENTGISVLEHDKRYGWRLLTWNDISHL